MKCMSKIRPNQKSNEKVEKPFFSVAEQIVVTIVSYAACPGWILKHFIYCADV